MAKQKAALVQARLHGAVPPPGAIKVLAALQAAGVQIAVALSSTNATVLNTTGLARFVEVRVDGVEARETNLIPRFFWRRCGSSVWRPLARPCLRMPLPASRPGGVPASRVIGVGRGAQSEALLGVGAGAVVGDLSEVDLG